MSGSWNGEPVLVTGGLGFIGSNLAIRLVELGARVTIVDSLNPHHGGDLHNIAPIADRVRVNISDLRDRPSLRVLARDQRYVFHLAGQVSHGDSMRDPELDLAVNCASTLNLLQACRHHNPQAVLVFTSTRQVYGRPLRLPVDEDHPTTPVDVNGVNKLTAEYYHLLYHRTYDLRSVVLRLTNTYGPRQKITNDRQGFVGVFLHRAMLHKEIQIWGDGNQRRDFNHVDDVVEAMLLAARNERCYGQVFNLGAQQHYSVLEFVAALRRLREFEFHAVPFPSDRRLIDIGDYFGDWSRFAAATGWQPRVGLDEGLRRTVDFFEQHASEYLT